MEHALAQFLSRFTYLALLAVLSAAGLGAPISEDLVLLLAGALAAGELTEFWPTLISGYVGVIIGDLLIHQWGTRMGPRAWKQPWVQRVLPPLRQEKLRAHFARHGMLTVVVGRHTPGLRAPIFFLAGASGVPFWRFLVADALSAAVTVPIVVVLGYKFAGQLDWVRTRIHHAQWIAGAFAVAALIGYLLVRRRHKAARARARAEANECAQKALQPDDPARDPLK